MSNTARSRECHWRGGSFNATSPKQRPPDPNPATSPTQLHLSGAKCPGERGCGAPPWRAAFSPKPSFGAGRLTEAPAEWLGASNRAPPRVVSKWGHAIRAPASASRPPSDSGPFKNPTRPGRVSMKAVSNDSRRHPHPLPRRPARAGGHRRGAPGHWPAQLHPRRTRRHRGQGGARARARRAGAERLRLSTQQADHRQPGTRGPAEGMRWGALVNTSPKWGIRRSKDAP